MGRIGQRLRALAACLVVLSLLAPGSLGARGGCGVCPSDCPMHRTVAVPTAHDMPCHRALEARHDDASGLALRAACGHQESGDLVIQLRHRPVPAAEAPIQVVPAPAVSPPRRPTSPALDVPIRPPRDLRSA